MKKKIISSSLVAVGFLLGATALSALADWTAPTAGCTPPTCNTDAPLNISSSAQSKLGKLTINAGSVLDEVGLTILGKIKIGDSSAVAGTANNKVLTSDANGVGTWQNNPIKAWVSWSRSLNGGAGGIRSSSGISSVTNAFSPVITFTTPMANANYTAICGSTAYEGAEETAFAYGRTTTSFRVTSAIGSGSDATNELDCIILSN